jgi:hypothetical protein
MVRGNLATLKHFSPKWQSGATQTVRLPIALVDQVLAYARSLDAGELSPDAPIKLNHLSQVIEVLEEVIQTPRNNFGQKPKARLQEAIDILYSLVTSE